MKILFLPITLLALTSCASLNEARASKGKVEQERSAILEVAGKYTKAFINKNYAYIESITQTPFIAAGNQETLTFQTNAELIGHYKSVRESLDDVSYSHSENYYRKIQFLNDSLAQILVVAFPSTFLLLNHVFCTFPNLVQ